MKGRIFIFFSASLFCLAYPCLACEPVVPMVILYSGTTIFSLIVFKSLAALAAVVAIKCAVFYYKSPVRKADSVVYMLFANIYSTLPGILLAVTFAAPILFLLAYPILLIPARNMKRYGAFKRLRTYGSAGLLFLLIIASMIFFGLAMDAQKGPLAWYWALKIVYSVIAMAISFAISIFCEDGVVSLLFEKINKDRSSFLEAVVWANAAAFIIVMGWGAIVALPKRLASPDFLIGTLKMAIAALLKA